MALSQAAVVIEGRRARQLAIGAAAAVTPVLEEGVYDCWCDVDCFIRVARADNLTPERGLDVTITNGYKIAANSIVPIQVTAQRLIGVIAAGAGTFNYHKSN